MQASDDKDRVAKMVETLRAQDGKIQDLIGTLEGVSKQLAVSEAVNIELRSRVEATEGVLMCMVNPTGQQRQVVACLEGGGTDAVDTRMKKKRKKSHPSRYNFFVQQVCEEYKQEHPANCIPPGGMMSYAANLWPTSKFNKLSEAYEEEHATTWLQSKIEEWKAGQPIEEE